MADPSPGASPSTGTDSQERLDSWKEIATHLKRDVTTVQRWEKRERMPVHRHVHDKLGSVYAFRSELDAWTRSRNEDGERSPEPIAATSPSTPRSAAPAPSLAAVGLSRSTLVRSLTVGALVLGLGAAWWLFARTDYFWRSPLADARFQHLTDLGGTEQAAAISRDGRFVAFQSDREGQMDVWVTQIGVGQSYNLTRGRVPELFNPSVRTLGFSPDGALVTFWRGKGSNGISVGAIPTLGGEPRPYLEAGAEYDWTPDGTRMVYHSSAPGDPTFVKESGEQGPGRKIFEAVAGRHAHFQIWSSDGRFIYFVQGSPPDAMDIWRIGATGTGAEQITHHNSRVSHPVLLNRRTLMYIAGDKDGSAPWLYSVDTERRASHRLSAGFDQYTSLSASADGRRLVATLANPNGTLWRLPVADTPVDASAGTPIPLTTGRGFSPRFGPGYLLYVSSTGTSQGIWKLVNGAATELWSAPDTRILGGPEVAPDGHQIAFSIEQRGKTLLCVMNADGTKARVVTASLELRGSPAWTPDGQSITSAANVSGTPHLFRISLDGSKVPVVEDYAVDPSWSPAGDLLVYSGADVGTTFQVKAVTAAGTPYAIPSLTLTRGARRMRFVQGRRALVVMRGDIQHKDLWLVDLETGATRQLTSLPRDFNVRDFDMSPDGREILLERVQERSDVVLIDLAPQK